VIILDKNCVTVKVGYNNKTIEVAKDSSILDFINKLDIQKDLDIIAAKVDNKIKDLHYKISNDCTIEFLDIRTDDGMRIYKRGLFFVLMKAVKQLFPRRVLNIRHSLGRGTYCEIYGADYLTKEDIETIQDRMCKIISENIPMISSTVSIDKAKQMFEKTGDYDKVSLLKHSDKKTLSIYNCGEMSNYLYGYLVPHTGYLKGFELMYYPPGFILRYPDKNSPDKIPEYEEQKKLFDVLNEHKRWAEILHVSHVGSLNEMIASGKINDLIHVSEALHERKIDYIADLIKKQSDDIRIILISGPSSSGKTTFAQRLAVSLKTNNLESFPISLDNYFVNREDTPLHDDGKPDFEALEAIDLKLFNEQLNDLLEGKKVKMPVYSFNDGCRKDEGIKVKLKDKQIMIIEGIHALNEKLTYFIPKKNKYKIYISALTQLSLDNYNPISTTDTRLIRRMVRDNKYRSNPAIGTLKMWDSVRQGEVKNIFPFQEEADIMFNSALIYELAILKDYAIPLLEGIDNTSEYYSEARRLIDFLSYFIPVSPENVPSTSILREFIGGSSFRH
jgi:uridine kinase